MDAGLSWFVLLALLFIVFFVLIMVAAAGIGFFLWRRSQKEKARAVRPKSRKCPQCGAGLPADAPEGLCPQCLLLRGLGSASVEVAITNQKPAQGRATDAERQEPSTAAYGGPFTAPAPTELAANFPQLEILELLGQGGMGAVYKARQPGLDRLVALKILPPEAGRDPAFAERFSREARALAKLNHPNIVAVYDFGQSGGLYYFLMEFVDGVNLRQALRAGRLQPPEALKIVPQICEALQYAHDEGIVHRDIKPENVLLDKKGRVKIADFGLAKLLERTPADLTLTGPQQVMGTLNYMAPEQMEKPLEVDHRADIYSVGVVFYEMLTGQLPLGRFALPSQKVQVDVRLDEVVLRALEREPGRRYQHISDVRAEVESITGGAPPAPSASRPTVPDQLLFRRVTILTLLALGAWAALLMMIAWGDIARTKWLRNKEMPYSWAIFLLWMVGIASMVYGSWWYYLLVKKPGVPRSLEGFWKAWTTPDPRIKASCLPLLICFGVWIVAIVAFNEVFVMAAYHRVLPIPLVIYLLTMIRYMGTMLAPFALMGAVWWAIRRRHRASNPAKIDTKPEAREE